MQKESGTREAQRRYRSRKKAQLEEFRQRVDTLNKRLADMDVKHAGLASQNKILEETAAAIQARQEKEAEAGLAESQRLWDARTASALCEFANAVRKYDYVVELSEEDASRLGPDDLKTLTEVFYRKVEEAVEDAAAGVNVNAKLLTLLQCKGHLRQALEFMGARKAAAVAAKLYPPRTVAELPTHEAIQRGLDQLELSEEQQEDILAARTKLLRKHREIRRERVEVVQRMQVVIEKDRGAVDETTNAGFLLEEVEALEQLKRNLEREHQGTYGFHLEFGETLTPLQYVKAMAYSHAVGVKPWPMAQLLAAKDAQARGVYVASLPQVEELHGPSEFFGNATYCKVQTPSGLTCCPDAGAANTKPSAPQPVGQECAALESSRSGTPIIKLESTNGTDSPYLDSLDDAQLLDDGLLDLTDPLDIDFGQPTSGENQQLWTLVQNLGNEPIGVPQ